MLTKWVLYKQDGGYVEGSCDLALEPGYDELMAVVSGALGYDPLECEHVSIYNGGGNPPYLDMFVHADGKGLELPENWAATLLYQANMRKHRHDIAPDQLDWICGHALVFQRKVWT